MRRLLPGETRGESAVEGTSGAVEFVLIRVRAEEAALQGEPSASEGSRASWFIRGRYCTVAGHGTFPSHGSASTRDRRCPGRIGWGKSVAVHAVTVAGVSCWSDQDATPDL